MFKTAITGCGRKFGARERELLESTVTAEILKGCNCFALVGQREFNKFALDACRAAQVLHPQIKIEVVLNDIGEAEKNFCGYAGTETVIYQPGSAKKERERRALEVCGALICCNFKKFLPLTVKKTLKRAKALGLRVINL